MRLYIGRSHNWDYEFGVKKDHWDQIEGFPEYDHLFGFCRKEFEKYSGLKLAPGEIRKVKSIKIELEE